MLGRIWMAFVKPVRKLYYNMTIYVRLGDCRVGDRRVEALDYWLANPSKGGFGVMVAR